MDPIREDLKELRADFKVGIDSLQRAVRDLGEKLSEHALEDADREGKLTGEIGIMRTKIESIADVAEDRQRFIRGWIGGLIAVAVTAGGGFLLRSAIDVKVAQPVQNIWQPMPPAAAAPPARPIPPAAAQEGAR